MNNAEYSEDKAMGEVRVKVRLFNATDEGLVRRGLLKPEQIRTYETVALVDTGAVRSVIPSHVRLQLGIELVGERVAECADGRKDVVGFTEPIRFEVLDRDTFDDALVLGDEVLIGQTILEKTDLLVDCARNRVIPNPAHPDQPVSKVK
ncbi:MAG: clan AA aspartic protease [Verrucomicrobia bacterium]|nr:clan AA aspartic protease [Verrucomicrobiota bacterium]